MGSQGETQKKVKPEQELAYEQEKMVHEEETSQEPQKKQKQGCYQKIKINKIRQMEIAES